MSIIGFIELVEGKELAVKPPPEVEAQAKGGIGGRRKAIEDWYAERGLDSPFGSAQRPPSLADRIQQASSVPDLLKVMETNRSHWTQRHTELAAARRAELKGAPA